MSDATLTARLILGLWLAMTTWTEVDAESLKSGTVEISQAQVGAVLGHTVGGGTLQFQGRSYPFNLAGLGAVGGGAPSIAALGEVYDLTSLSDFAGTYRERPRTESPPGEFDTTVTLINEHGVTLRLRSRRADAVLKLGPKGARIRLSLE